MRFSPLLVVIVTLLAHLAAASVPCAGAGGPQPAAHAPQQTGVPEADAHAGHHGHAPAEAAGHATSHAAHSGHSAESGHSAKSSQAAAAEALPGGEWRPACRCGCGEGTPLARAAGKRLGPALPASPPAPVCLEPAHDARPSAPALPALSPSLPEPVPISSAR